MEKRLIIDRFEEDLAVIEYGDITFDFPRALLPEGAKPSDVLDFTVVVKEQETADRKAEARSLMERLRKK